jgi:hypothetical protein
MNRATQTIVSTMGVFLGLSGMNHGFFETLQGTVPTPGLIVQAIGPAQRFWIHGTEEAFTFLPNFLLTGLAAMLVGLAIIVWSVGFIHTRHGPAVFLLLCICLFLVGGGIGQVVFFIPAWAVSTRIHKPLTWWRKVLPAGARPVLAKIWPFSVSLGSFCFLVALEIAIFGFMPGLSDPEQILYTCWYFLLAAWLLYLLSFVSGFASDIQQMAPAPKTALHL